MNGVQREKLSLKGITKGLTSETASSTRNLGSQRDTATPSSRRANFESFHKAANKFGDHVRSPSKKGESASSKSNLVAWDNQSPKRKQGSIIDEKAFKTNTEVNQVKKNYQSFYSPKVSHSVERALMKTDKELTFTATKLALLPSLKHSQSQKTK